MLSPTYNVISKMFRLHHQGVIARVTLAIYMFLPKQVTLYAFACNSGYGEVGLFK